MSRTRPLAQRLIDALHRKKMTLACAESCTGGLFGARLTEPAGASGAFLGGVISYHDDVKAKVLRVDAQTLEKKGAVTREIAAQMATGARTLLGADVAVSITGFAGPKVPPGGELGLVYLGVAHAGGVEVHELHFPDDRAAVREGAAEAAMEYALAVVERSP